MESITRQVSELKSEERRVYEAVLGQQLHENQQIILQVITLSDQTESEDSAADPGLARLPDWCNVYGIVGSGDCRSRVRRT